MDEKVKQLTPQQVAKLLADNSRDVQDLISSYLSLLEKISGSGVTGSHQFKEVTALIQNILSIEMKHVKQLADLTSKLSGIQPVAD